MRSPMTDRRRNEWIPACLCLISKLKNEGAFKRSKKMRVRMKKLKLKSQNNSREKRGSSKSLPDMNEVRIFTGRFR